MKKKLLLALLCVSAARCALESGVPVQDFLGNYLPFKIIVKDHTTDSGRRNRLKEFVNSKEEVTEEQWLQFKEDFNKEDLGVNPGLLLEAILRLRVDVLGYWQSLGLDLEATYEKLVTEKPEPLFHYLIQRRFLTSADQDKFEFLAQLFPQKLEDSNQGNSLIHVAIQKDWLLLAQKVKNRGISLDVQNKKGETALHTAVKKSDEKFLVWLIENGAKVDLENIYDETAWDILNEQNKAMAPQPNDDAHEKIARHLKGKKIQALMIVYIKLVGGQLGKEAKQGISKRIQDKEEKYKENKNQIAEQKEKLAKQIEKLEELEQKEEEQTNNDIYALQEQLKEFELNR